MTSEPVAKVASPHPGPLPEREGARSIRCALAIVAWILVFVIALMLDSRVAIFMHTHGVEDFLHTHKLVRETLKAPGEFYFTIVIAIIAGVVHREHVKSGLFVILATAISGVNGAIKWIVGRTRPFKLHEGLVEPFAFSPFRGGIPGAFKSTNLCFPSGHAALAFATAAALAILWPRLRWAFYFVATLVGIERFCETAHWLSDTVAGAALGIGGVRLIWWLWWRKLATKG